VQDVQAEKRLHQLLELPNEAYLAECIQPIEVNIIHQVREFLRTELASILENDFLANYQKLAQVGKPYRLNREDIATRLLKNTCLSYLLKLGDRYRDLVNNDLEQTTPQLDHFYQQWQHDSLVLDKWFEIQATAPDKEILHRVQTLVKHDAFNLKNPNKVYALMGAFCARNPIGFHREDGAGYEFLGDYILELNTINPYVAARLVRTLSHWRKFALPYQALMKTQLERIAKHEGLCKNVSEIVNQSL